MSGGGGGEKSLEQTPSWAVALVCTVFVVASLLVERGIHWLGRYFKRSNQRELYHTLEVIKNELMVLGFISLFLTVFQSKVASLCMAEKLNRIMLPCKYAPPAETNAGAEAPVVHRKLFAVEAESSGTCSAGHVQVISEEGLHQLHIFIFVMAVVHVLYSCLTVLVGLWQVHSWKKWEVEARSARLKALDEALNPKHRRHEHGDEFTKGRIRYKFLYTSRTGLNLDSYIYSFFRQFGRPIYKEDYLCLRMGFIATHQLNAEYDFHSYIRRTMEEDFKVVVGISSYLWAFVCIFLLLDIDGWYSYFWIAFIPTFLVLIVGTKLQQIIINLALEVRGGVEKIDISSSVKDDESFKAAEKPKQEVVCQPMRPRDDLFWFRKPHFLIHLVHFILFQNAFELAFFFWAMFEYGFTSCLVGRTWMIIVRLVMGVFVQILCSASTLPLYALVSQMGSTVRFTVFNSESAQSAIHNWRDKAHKKQKKVEHKTLSHHLAGIMGLNKSVDEQGHVHDVELHHTGDHHEKGHHDKHSAKDHPHLHPHPHPHKDVTHVVEIDQAPVKDTQNSSARRVDDQGPPASEKSQSKDAMSLVNVLKLARNKEKGQAPGSS